MEQLPPSLARSAGEISNPSSINLDRVDAELSATHDLRLPAPLAHPGDGSVEVTLKPPPGFNLNPLPGAPPRSDSDSSSDELADVKQSRKSKLSAKFKAARHVAGLRNQRRYPLGTCTMNWVKANDTMMHETTDYAMGESIAGECNAARFMLNWSLLGPSLSGILCVAQIVTLVLFAIGLPLVAMISGGTLCFCCTFVANSCNMIGKLLAVRFQTLQNGGNIESAIARVWCIAPEEVVEPQRAALERFMSFRGSLQPVGGPLGCVWLVVSFIPLFLNRNQDTVQTWERAVFWCAIPILLCLLGSDGDDSRCQLSYGQDNIRASISTDDASSGTCFAALYQKLRRASWFNTLFWSL
eukprot:COSAG02_NODE_930_length_15835_cov_114.387201_2_plen_355_part_00